MNHWHMTHKSIISRTILYAFTGLLLLSQALYASSVVEPSRFLFSTKKGGTITGVIKVTNPGKEVAEMNAVNYDWTLNDLDKMVTSECGTRPDSLKGIIKFNPRSFKLAPGASQHVRFTLTLPENADLLERRGIVFFEEKSQINPNQSGAQVLTQVGSTIYLGVEGMRMAFALQNAGAEKSANGNYQGIAEISNQGAGHVRYKINYKIISETGKLFLEDSLPEKVILPGFNRTIRFPFTKRPAPGKYNLLLSISLLGTNQTAAKTVPFEVKN